MSRESSASKSHATTWTLLFIVALPVIYLLAMPPLYFIALRTEMWRADSPPAWVVAAATPYDWLERRTPLKKPLDAYAEWWMNQVLRDIIARPPPP